ncbi:MAG: DUF2147 domain-containing protein [Burkholderiales bacterium]|nr:DUF2147 domain-containing protein [Burkholderiales bacterium]
MKPLLVLLSLASAAAAALAQGAPATAAGATSPVGLWQTLADDGKSARSLVRITESGGVVSGRIEKILDPALQDARCTHCLGDQQGAPLLGLEVLRQLRAEPGEAGTWAGGLLVDPSTGRTLRARLKVQPDGRALEARASLGPVSRSQTWTRVE